MFCTNHAQNLVKAFDLLKQNSSQYLNNQFFEWVGCFAHLLNLGIGYLFELEKFFIFYIHLNKILNICKNLSIIVMTNVWKTDIFIAIETS